MQSDRSPDLHPWFDDRIKSWRHLKDFSFFVYDELTFGVQ